MIGANAPLLSDSSNPFNYNLLINKRVANKRSILGKMYLEKTYIKKTSIVNVNVTWFIKKKGTNWGMYIKKRKVRYKTSNSLFIIYYLTNTI